MCKYLYIYAVTRKRRSSPELFLYQGQILRMRICPSCLHISRGIYAYWHLLVRSIRQLCLLYLALSTNSACLHSFLLSFLPSFVPSCLLASIPSWFLPACLPASLPAFLLSCPPACLPSYLPPCLPSCLPSFLPSCLPAFLTAFLPACLPSCLLPAMSSLRCYSSFSVWTVA